MNKLDAQIGYRIRNKREQIRYSRETLSGLTGISVKFLYYVEQRQYDMTISKLLKICSVLNTYPGYILTGKYDENEQMMHLFHRLPASQKSIVLDFLAVLSQQQTP